MKFSIAVVRKIAEIMTEAVQEKLAEGVQVAEIEQALRELAKVACGLGLQKMIEAQEAKYASRVSCGCGAEAEPLGMREAVVWSVFGKVNYRRRYYRCPDCHRGSHLWTSD